MKRKQTKRLREPTRARKIIADLKAQAPNNSYGPPTYYEDFTFACADCGKVETWTAGHQKVYYEEWKRPIYGTAKHCRECRKRRQTEKVVQRERSSRGKALSDGARWEPRPTKGQKR